MKRERSNFNHAAVKRERTLLLVPKPPGGYLIDPPEDCKKMMSYCPDPKRYQSIPVVEYVRCRKCSFGEDCYRKIEEDKGSRKRINFQRYGA